MAKKFLTSFSVDGNVGIGTASPLSKIHVSGTGTSNSIRVGNSEFFAFSTGGGQEGHPTFRSAVTNGNTILRVMPNGTSTNAQFEFFGNDFFSVGTGLWHNFKITSSSTNYIISTEAGANETFKPIIIKTGPSITNLNQIYLSTDGRVGIGNSSPQTKLDVTGSISVSEEIVLQNGLSKSSSITISLNNINTAIDSFSAASYTSAEYFVQMKQGTLMTTSRFMLIYDGTDINIHEYGMVHATAGAANATISASISDGTISVTATSSNAATTNVVVKSMIQYIKN